MKKSSRDDSPESASSLRESVRRQPTMPDQHGGLVIGLCHVLMARTVIPRSPTLLMIDEAASLGTVDQLPLMYSYLRGSGVTVYTAWQSLGQLIDLYPIQYRTILENCASLQTFVLHCTCVDAMAGLLGISPSVMRALSSDEQVVATSSRGTEVPLRVDYRSHAVLKGLADPNPRYRGSDDADTSQTR